MAKAHFKCADCGSDVACGGKGYNRSRAESLAKWHESKESLCDDCSRARLDEVNELKAEANAKAELPELTGSEAQVKWAEGIRHDFLAKLDRAVEAVKIKQTPVDHWERVAFGDLVDSVRQHVSGADHEEFIRIANVIADVCRSRVSARWWIDTRDMGVGGRIDALHDAIAATLRPAPPPTSAEVEAQTEALLKTSGEPKSDVIAEVAYVGKELRVRFAEMNENFRLLMRAIGFTWQKPGGYWGRTLDFRSGDPSDRVAEVAHRVIDAGFMIRVHDDTARAKAISGDFAPEQTRWVSISRGGKYDGWLRITWSREDDCYAAAKRINGACYGSGGVYCPPESIEEVMDFADRHGFSVSESPRKILAQRRAELAQGVVIATPKKPKPLKIKDQKRPEKLEVVEVGIDDDLLDND